MKRHKRIERIAAIYKRREEQARAVWVQAEQNRQAAEEQAQQSAAALRDGVDTLRGGPGACDPQAVLHGQWAVQQLERLHKAQLANARRMAQIAEGRRSPWMDKRQDLLTMEKWYERAKEQWLRERALKEEAAMESTLEAHLTRKYQLESE
ncbi:MAG: hypothetical protein R3F17_01250 [Planctomycetota bacterium]